MEFSEYTFECRLYISPRHQLAFRLPAEPGPKRLARLRAPEYDELTDPAFRGLLAAFESIQQSPLKIVQV